MSLWAIKVVHKWALGLSRFTSVTSFSTTSLSLTVALTWSVQDFYLLHKQPLTNFQANLPNLRRLFVEARTEVEENEYSRTAVHPPILEIIRIV